MQEYLPAEEQAQKTSPYAVYQGDPVRYASEVLHLRLTPHQAEILCSIVVNRRTAAKASHAIGKTFVAAIAACYWYDCWDEHIVYITAPTWKQAIGLTFKTITRLRRKNKLPGRILDTGKILDADKYAAGGHFIQAINAENGEGFQGEHTAPILQIYEEAVGVPGYIWEAGDGLMTTDDNRILAIANPTDESTHFGVNCASTLWYVITINGMVHPNVVAGLESRAQGEHLTNRELPFPDAVSLLFVEEMIEKECSPSARLEGDAFEFPPGSGCYYIPNAIFQGRVQGEFPSQANEQVVPRAWLTGLPVHRAETMPEIGCDPARFGTDRSCIAGRSGPCLLQVREIRQMDVDVVAGECILMAEELGAEFGFNPKLLPIRVDVTGGLGAAPAVFLRIAGYSVIEVNSSETAIEAETYPNVRSELWFATRERARTKDLDLSRLPPKMRELVIRELTTPKWKPNARGQKRVEQKDEIKKRLKGDSPDIADAVNLAYYGKSSRSLVDHEQMMAQLEAQYGAA